MMESWQFFLFILQAVELLTEFYWLKTNAGCCLPGTVPTSHNGIICLFLLCLFRFTISIERKSKYVYIDERIKDVEFHLEGSATPLIGAADRPIAPLFELCKVRFIVCLFFVNERQRRRRTETGCSGPWTSHACGLRDGECSLTSPNAKLCIWGPAIQGTSTKWVARS